MNKKGFTVIELILSFAFVSILTVSLFTLVMNYKTKEQQAADITELNQYKDNMTMLIQNDIEQKLLKKVEYCMNGTERISKCVDLYFQDNTVKRLQIAYKEVQEERHSSSFAYYKYYIIYDETLYPTPAEGQVEIRSDFMLEQTSEEDAIENNLGLYRIKIDLYHKDLAVNASISITATGNAKARTTETGPYNAYTTGQRISIILNNGNRKNKEYFHVIEDSDTFDSNVTLLYDCVWNVSTKEGICGNLAGASGAKVAFNADKSHGNKFEGSTIYDALTSAYEEWNNIDGRKNIRLLTANEATKLTGTTHVARLYDANSPTGLNSNNEFLFRSDFNGGSYPLDDFWTSSNYLTTGTEDSAWFIDTNSRQLKKDVVNNQHYIRPVIRVNKVYILGVE